MQATPLKPEDQLVFIHILKTAGQSVMQILEANFPEDKRLFANSGDIVNLPRESLQSYQLILGHNYYPIHELLGRKPLYLTFLRDPVERTISHYYHWQRPDAAGHKFHEKVLSQTLAEFVTDPMTRPAVFNYQTRWIAAEDVRGPAPMDGADLLNTAKQRLEEFAFVGIVEEFDRSISALVAQFNWTPPASLEKRNVDPLRDQRSRFPDETIALIREATKWDAELYEYARALFDRRYPKTVDGSVEDVLAPGGTGS
jgi:hypothetical protein